MIDQTQERRPISEIARERRQIVVGQMGAFLMVGYPSRKTPDLYLALQGHPTFCAQCERTFPECLAEFTQHIYEHAPRRDRRRAEGIMRAYANDYAPGDETV